MDGITGHSGTRLGAWRVVAAVMALIFLALLAAAAGPEAGSDPGVESREKSGLDKAEERPTALEHVMDETDTWELFPSLKGVKLFGLIPLDRVPLPHWSCVVFGRTITLRLTKFMILELIAAAIVAAIFLPVARRLRSGEPARGAS